MPFQYSEVLLVGATSGIVKALADGLISEGSHVIAVGRRQQNPDEFVAQHGKSKVSSMLFDIAGTSTRFPSLLRGTFSSLLWRYD